MAICASCRASEQGREVSMTHRLGVWTLAVGTCVAVILLGRAPHAAQAPAGTTSPVVKSTGSVKAKTWKGRTPDGQLDLQGFWNNSTYTPMERPKNVTKAFYTKGEVLEIQRRAAEAERGSCAPLDSIRAGTTAPIGTVSG